MVRETGGLKDTVVPYNEFTNEGTGFSFANYNSHEMLHVLKYAMQVFYDDKKSWNNIIRNAMKSDYSWDISADKYIEMYSSLCGVDVKKPQTAQKKPAPKKETKTTPAKTVEKKTTTKAENKTTVKKAVKDTKKK